MRCFIALLATGVLQLALGQAPCLQNHIHDRGRIAMNVASTSILGNSSEGDAEAMGDPCQTGRWAPQLEYPRGSGVQYLYMGSMWVGALLEEEDGSLTPRVSFGSEGWERNVTELYGGPSCAENFREGSRIPQAQSCGGAGIFDPVALADQEFTFSYSDTLVNFPEVVPGQHFDEQDGDHRPLGLSITQHSYQWGVEPDYGSLLLLRYDIRNISDRALHSPFAGLYLDADVQSAEESSGYTDDLVLFRSYAQGGLGDSTQVRAMVFLDNDGRLLNDVSGNDYVCPAALALMPLGAGDAMGSFNWWNSNGDQSRDYGPAWTWWSEHPEFGLAWSDSIGTPESDRRKYELMSNGEFDPPWYAGQADAYPPQPIYDENGQIVEWRSWMPPGEWIDALGDDVRGLLSFGPLGTPDGVDELGRPRTLLPPGEQATFWFALVMGDDLHQACCPQPDIENQVDPSLFDFTSLDHRLRLAKTWFDGGLSTPLPIPPALAFDTPAPGQIHLNWAQVDDEPQPLFRLERTHLQSGVVTLLAEATTALQWSDTIAEGDSLLYRLQELWPNGLRSAATELLVAPDYPVAVTDLTVTPGNQRIDLAWASDAPEVMIVHGVMPENFNRTAYCWPPQCPFMTDTTRLANTGAASLTGLANLYRHFVKVHAVGANQLASAAEWRNVIPRARGVNWRVINAHRSATADTAHSRANINLLFAQSELSCEYRVRMENPSQTLARVELDGCDNLWLNMDSSLPYSLRLCALDLVGLLESGGGFLSTGMRFPHPSVEIPRDPLNAANVETRAIPAAFSEAFTAINLPSGWELQIEDPLLGVLQAADSQPGSTLMVTPFEEGANWSHAGRYVAPDHPEFDGRPAALTFSDAGFVHQLKTPLYAVDMEASLGYFNNLLEIAAVGLPQPVEQPSAFRLLPCAPNPFNPDTRVTFELDQAGEVDLRVYDLLGRQVRVLIHEPCTAGNHHVLLRGEGLASGVYFLRLESTGRTQTQKVLLLK